MTITERYEMVTAALAAGRTVYFCQYAGMVIVTPKNAAKFAAIGRPIVKVSKSGTELLVARGTGYERVTHSAIRVEA